MLDAVSSFVPSSGVIVVSTSIASILTSFSTVESEADSLAVALSATFELISPQSSLFSSFVLELTSGDICSAGELLVDAHSLDWGVVSRFWLIGVTLRREGVGGGDDMLNTLPGDMLRSERLCGEKLRVDWL